MGGQRFRPTVIGQAPTALQLPVWRQRSAALQRTCAQVVAQQRSGLGRLPPAFGGHPDLPSAKHQAFAVHGLRLVQGEWWHGLECLEATSCQAPPAADAAAGGITQQPQFIAIGAEGTG